MGIPSAWRSEAILPGGPRYSGLQNPEVAGEAKRRGTVPQSAQCAVHKLEMLAYELFRLKGQLDGMHHAQGKTPRWNFR